MNKLYLGIDPGATGALCAISEGHKPIVYDFGDGALVPFLQELVEDSWQYEIIALVEKVHAMPKQGVSSSFKFGENLGRWCGRLEALDIPFSFTTPQRWQKIMFGPEPKIWMTRKGIKKLDTKAMSLQVARQLFPEVRDRLTRKKDNGRSDAILIAEYLRRLDKGVI